MFGEDQKKEVETLYACGFSRLVSWLFLESKGIKTIPISVILENLEGSPFHASLLVRLPSGKRVVFDPALGLITEPFEFDEEYSKDFTGDVYRLSPCTLTKNLFSLLEIEDVDALREDFLINTLSGLDLYYKEMDSGALEGIDENRFSGIRLANLSNIYSKFSDTENTLRICEKAISKNFSMKDYCIETVAFSDSQSRF